MTLALLKVGPGKFQTADKFSFDKQEKLKSGAVIMATVKKSRNLLFHNRLFALINFFLEQQEEYNTERQVLNMLYYVLGYTENVKLPDGSVALFPQSISFDKMDQEEFEKFSAGVPGVLAGLLGITADELLNEFEEVGNEL